MAIRKIIYNQYIILYIINNTTNIMRIIIIIQRLIHSDHMEKG